MAGFSTPNVSLSIAVGSSINSIFTNTDKRIGNPSVAADAAALFTVVTGSTKVVIVEAIAVLKCHSISPSFGIGGIVPKAVNTRIRRALKLGEIEFICRP